MGMGKLGPERKVEECLDPAQGKGRKDFSCKGAQAHEAGKSALICMSGQSREKGEEVLGKERLGDWQDECRDQQGEEELQ